MGVKRPRAEGVRGRRVLGQWPVEAGGTERACEGGCRWWCWRSSAAVEGPSEEGCGHDTLLSATKRTNIGPSPPPLTQTRPLVYRCSERPAQCRAQASPLAVSISGIDRLEGIQLWSDSGRLDCLAERLRIEFLSIRFDPRPRLGATAYVVPLLRMQLLSAYAVSLLFIRSMAEGLGLVACLGPRLGGSRASLMRSCHSHGLGRLAGSLHLLLHRQRCV